MTKTTGQFISEIKNLTLHNISLLQFEENGKIEQGINDFKVSNEFVIKTTPYFQGVKKTMAYLRATWKIFKEIKSTNDFVYIFYPGHISLLVAYACIIFDKSYGLYVRGEYNLTLSKLIFKKARFINTVGILFQKEIKLSNSNCNLIRPMVQFDFSKKEELLLKKKNKEILFVGRIEKRKGVWEIINAAKELKEEFPQYKLRLIGAGQDSENIAHFIAKEKLSNVILQGPVFNQEELKQFYQQSEIFLFPSYDEGFPRVLYEALFFKLPIITTFVGNISGIMQNEHNCLEIKVKSSESINLQLSKLIRDTELSNLLAKNGEEALSQIFNAKIKSHSELLINQLAEYEQ